MRDKEEEREKERKKERKKKSERKNRESNFISEKIVIVKSSVNKYLLTRNRNQRNSTNETGGGLLDTNAKPC